MKRKSIIMAVLAVLQLCSSLRALPTTAYEAEMVVTGWLKADAKPLDTDLGRQVMRVETFTDDYGEPVYYIVYLQPSGFVIVSADDLVEPIIGFSDDGTYDPSLENPLGALVTNDLNGRIATVRSVVRLQVMAEAEDVSFTETQRKWRRFISLAETDEGSIRLMGLPSISESDVRVAPLTKTKWAQSDVCWSPCYNYYTPNHYACGCTATAMAQLMRYHEHPQTGIGEKCFWVLVDGQQEYLCTHGGDDNGGPYNWTNMVPEPDCFTTEAQRQAIGALCYDAAISSGTEFSDSGSGSLVEYAVTALLDTFGYSNGVFAWNQNRNIGSGLNGMINPNLDAGYPVILGIVGLSGHSVLADGYGYGFSTLYHHLNMGWSGSDDAWYNLPDIDSSWPGPFDTIDECGYNVFTSGRGEIISGRVTNTSGNPISDATVTALEKDGTDVKTDETDTKGIYALVAVNSGSTYIISVTKQGHFFEPNEVEVQTGISHNNRSISGNKWGIDFVGEPDNCETITIGTGTSDWYQPMRTNWHDSRTQVIYLASEIGRSGTITELALDVTIPPGQTMNNWTIRMKHTSMNEYDTCSLDVNDWTIVYQKDETVDGTGWRTFEFGETPFEYNGTDNLLVDLSHNNSSYTSNGKCMASSPGGARSVYAYSDSNYGDPLNWFGPNRPTVSCSDYVPNVKLTFCDDNVVFEDTFPLTTIDLNKWTVVDGATVDGTGGNEPSPPYSLRLNGHPLGGDSVESKVIDLSCCSGATLTYYYQRTGGGNSPENGDDLIIDYNDGSNWVELSRQPGDGPDMAVYEPNTVTLPPAALHPGFRLRIRSIGTSSSFNVYDDWFVDDVKIEVTDGAPPNVLICGANDDYKLEDIQQKLLGTGQFVTVDILDARDVTPTLEELQTFDSVLVHRSSEYQDATAIGNVMADYVDSGGGVVCMMFEVGLDDSYGTMMQGRWSSEEYYAIPRGSHEDDPHATLGTVYDPGHPIMQGVSSFDGGSSSFRPSTYNITLGAVRVADWSDGRPLVVTKTIGSARRVDLAFYPVSSDVDSDWWDSSTDGALLMANALTWVALAE